MKKSNLILIFSTLLLISGPLIARHKVLERNATGGGFFGYKTVTSDVTVFEISVNNKIQTVTGYSVNCQDPGYEGCPKLGAEFLPTNPSNDWDQVQISATDFLMDFALNQIKNGVQSGSSFRKIKVDGETGYRIYEVIWSSTGNITITRDQLN